MTAVERISVDIICLHSANGFMNRICDSTSCALVYVHRGTKMRRHVFISRSLPAGDPEQLLIRTCQGVQFQARAIASEPVGA
jgi:hypothetical protein